MKNSLQEHQQVLRQLLEAMDAVCKKHGIHYLLFAGSALGAVRHGDFIPWDDDLDVVMLRPDYERFLAVAEQELDGETYFLQKEFSSHWPMFFSKLRKNNTACMERFVPRDPQMHQGVYLDIFPCDNLAEGKMMRNLQFLASRVVVAQALDRRGYRTDSGMKKIFMALCRHLPQHPLRRLITREKEGASPCVHTFFGGGSEYRKNVFPRTWFENAVYLPFAGGEYPVSACCDRMLTRIYGDYMTPLPEEERKSKVHGALVDLENSYLEYLQWQKNADFESYARTIR